MTTFKVESNEQDMRHTLFISDLHLQEETPKITEMFMRLLHQQAPSADALYILGDCFETWIGDDDHSPFNQKIVRALHQLSTHGVPIYLMRGNRDFLIDEVFAQASGVTLLKDPAIIILYGKSVLLSHGDILCTLDHKHQSFRKTTQWRWLQKLFLTLPLSLRRKIAHQLRKKSRNYNATLAPHITDVTDEAVKNLMQLNNTSLLIHGHTHRSAIHEINLDEHPGQRIVLGAWHERGNALIYHEDGSYRLIEV